VSAGGFVKLPDALLYDPDISAEALRAYMALARYATGLGADTFDLTADALGTLLGRSHDRANLWTRELERRGLLLVERNRGRARPNRYTVLDPQEVVFAGLHVARSTRESASPKAHAETREPAHAETREPVKKEERARGDRGVKRTTPLPQPVDNGGAPRPPRRPRCTVHEPPGSWSDAADCRGCLADAKAAGYSRRPAF
jgi:hypothetical protein